LKGDKGDAGDRGERNERNTHLSRQCSLQYLFINIV
jgi:hypothetical protein